MVAMTSEQFLTRADTGQSGPVVQLTGIKKSFGLVEVLHGVDLSVRAGEHVVIFGPSGSGKSTVLRTINLLEQPSEGSVRIAGVEYGPGALAPGEKRGSPVALRRQVGMVFQQFNLFPHLTALDNCVLPLRSNDEDQPGRRRGARRQRPAPGRPAALGRALPGRALGRAAAARRDRARAEPGSQGHAVRRADLGARPRARRRGARDDAKRRRVGHDDGRRHARDGVRARGRRPQHLHGQRPDRRLRAARVLRHHRERAHARSSSRPCCDRHRRSPTSGS